MRCASSVLIVGAGFCGMTLATELLRRSAEGALHITIVDPAVHAGGVAYAPRTFPFLLNVPAGRMSAAASDPLEFLRFARQRDAQATVEDFRPRAEYGAYLQERLANAQALAANARLERVCGVVIALERSLRGQGFTAHLQDGRRLSAHAVVLALGNPPPHPVGPDARVLRSARFVADPWAQALRIRPGERVLLLGTGLTMADVACALDAHTGGKVQLHALSRHGLLPLSQDPFRPVLRPQEAVPELDRAARSSARALLQAARALAARIQTQGGDWREAATLLRTAAPVLWQQLAPRERRRFLRHVRVYWEIHRHRLAPPTAQRLSQLERCGRLTIYAGRLRSCRRAQTGLIATWRPRGGRQRLVVQPYDRIINCTGPDYDLRRSENRLWRSLTAEGLVVPDNDGLGLITGRAGAVLSRTGQPVAGLHYLGPMLRPRYWECTAVAELRDHAVELAQELLALRGESRRTRPAAAAHRVSP